MIYPKTDLQIENLRKWEGFLRALFSNRIPTSSVWESENDILMVLNALGEADFANHSHMPDSGGLDIVGAQGAAERGCIEIHYDPDAMHIVKPISLMFESFGNDYQWAYFRLETGNLEPKVERPESGTYHEYVVEYPRGHYLDMSILHHDWYDPATDEVVAPEGAREVMRYLSGAFVTVAKGSSYQDIPRTYSGLHNQMNSRDFRAFIEKMKARWPIASD